MDPQNYVGGSPVFRQYIRYLNLRRRFNSTKSICSPARSQRIHEALKEKHWTKNTLLRRWRVWRRHDAPPLSCSIIQFPHMLAWQHSVLKVGYTVLHAVHDNSKSLGFRRNYARYTRAQINGICGRLRDQKDDKARRSQIRGSFT